MTQQTPATAPTLIGLAGIPIESVEQRENRCLNIVVFGRRTSMRIDRATLTALDQMARAEGITRRQIIELTASRLPPEQTLSSALRTLLVAYWMRRAETAA